MTLIVGMRCTDGVVIGADGASTYATIAGQRTILQPTRKIDIIDKRVIAAVSGSVGLGQRLKEAVRLAWVEKKLSGKSAIEGMCVLSQQMRPHVLQELAAALQVHAASNRITKTALLLAAVRSAPREHVPRSPLHQRVDA